jgi:hypothetical protein
MPQKLFKAQKRPQDPQQGSGSPSADTVAVEKQQPYSQGPHVDTHVDPMTNEAATFALRRHSFPGQKQTKLATSSTAKQASGPALCPGSCEDLPVLPVQRQYLTRSKAHTMVAQPCSGKPRTSN